MTALFQNENDYGMILLRDNYEDAIAESEEMYDRECERKNCSTPKEERTTKYLLGVKENVLSGQIGLHIPPNKSHIEIPEEAIYCEHIDNPLWVNYDFLNGNSKMVLGSGPFGFGMGIHFVDPKETRRIFQGNFSPELVQEVRSSTRKYTIEVHEKCKRAISDILRSSDCADYIHRHIDSDLFEEVVADILRDQGFDVFLTSRTGDGGKDLWASISISGKRYTVLVECKKRDRKKAIDPLLARSVVGSFYVARGSGINADFAMLVTSSDNIGPETARIEQCVREFTIKDCNDILGWANKYGSLRNGLWIPSALEGLL